MATDKENSATPLERLNYFNYFTEVEEEFVRRRGKPLLISPMDWALIESWKSAGIPLHVVLRAINQAFDAYDARPRKYRRVNSVFYCQQEVESTYAEYCLAQVGASPEKSKAQTQDATRPSSRKRGESQSIFPREVLLDFFARSDGELHAAEELAAASAHNELLQAISRARARLAQIRVDVEKAARIDTESIERDLDAIDRMMVDAATRLAGEVGILNLRREAEAGLAAYKKKMDADIYKQTMKNYVLRRLREIHGLPRLSLFYL
ncbi:MAG TPA: hypothetical protein VIG62_20800 [Blastocatellia bacterium]